MPPIVEKCLVQIQALQAAARPRATRNHVVLGLLEHLSLCEAHLLDVIGETSPSVARQSLVDALAECIRARASIRHLGAERPACEARFLILQGLLQPYVPNDVEDVGDRWREVVHRMIVNVGIVWPSDSHDATDFNARDHILYNLCGHAERLLVQEGILVVGRYKVLGYVFELVIGPKGASDKVMEYLRANGWGCPLPHWVDVSLSSEDDT